MPEPLRVGAEGKGDLLAAIPRAAAGKEEEEEKMTTRQVLAEEEEDDKLEDLEMLKAALGSSKSA